MRRTAGRRASIWRGRQSCAASEPTARALGVAWNAFDLGLVNAAALPEALRFNRPALASAIPEIAHALDVAGGDADDEFRRILQTVESCLGKLPVPTKLRDLALTYDMLPRIAKEAMDDWALATNPRFRWPMPPYSGAMQMPNTPSSAISATMSSGMSASPRRPACASRPAQAPTQASASHVVAIHEKP